MTADGTEYFENLKKVDDKEFNKELEEMRIQISNSIPVDESRLTFLNHFLEFDRIDRRDLLFIIFKIDSSNNDGFNNKTSKDVFEDFSKLFEFDNNIETPLDNNSYTRYIDKKFRPNKTCKYYYI